MLGNLCYLPVILVADALGASRVVFYPTLLLGVLSEAIRIVVNMFDFHLQVFHFLLSVVF